nr:MAG TPA: hypothetical protein [Caudoviricetes sp.]
MGRARLPARPRRRQPLLPALRERRGQGQEARTREAPEGQGRRARRAPPRPESGRGRLPAVRGALIGR